MACILEEYTISDAFIGKMQRMSFNDYKDEYAREGDTDKKVRNHYDNRMRPKNLILYYFDSEMDRLKKKPYTKEIGTQTDISHVGKKIKKIKDEGINAIAFVVPNK
tara:strand:- start:133 stop:450 length:318 start_codon:yes stop_codon:yes gene_type:complete